MTRQTLYRLVREWMQEWGGRITLLLAGYVVVLLALYRLDWAPPMDPELFYNVIFWPVGVAAVGLGVRAARRSPEGSPARRAWVLISLAYLSYFLGDVIWADHDDPLATWADLAYLATYPLLLAGLLSFRFAPGETRERTMFWQDVATLLIASGMVVWHLLLGPAAAAAEDPAWFDIAVTVAYPLADLVLLFGAAVVALQGWQQGTGRALVFLALSALLLVTGDLAWGHLVLAGEYQSGDWPDGIWLVGQYLMVLAAQYYTWQLGQKTDPWDPTELSKCLQTVLPYLGIGVTYGLLLRAGLETADRNLFGLMVGAMAVTVIAVYRQWLLLRQNERLLEQSRALAAEIQASETRFRSMFQNSSDVITIVGSDSIVRYQSPSMERVLGYHPDEIVGGTLHHLIHPDDVTIARAFLRESRAGTGTHRMLELRARHKSGDWRHVEVTVDNLTHDPTVGGVVLITRDVSDRKALEEQMRYQAFHDPLTGLVNRALFRDRVGHALSHQQRFSEPLAVLFLDLDHFKNINDSLGHGAGDQLLVAVAQRLLACVRSDDTVARLGGDEFAILLEGAGGPEAGDVARRIMDAMKAPFQVQHREVHVSTSLGIAVSHHGEETAEDLLRNADIAMYKAKGLGQGRYELFEPSMHTSALERLELEGDLRHALDAGQFVVHYQPTVNLLTGDTTGFEALIRWLHPRRGLVPPAQFISIAEQRGLILPIGRWVLHTACNQVQEWREQYPHKGPLSISVNLSVKQLLDPGLVEDVHAALSISALPPESLILEVTETVLMHSTDEILLCLGRLKSLGVRLAIDDFGTGYSSLDYLRRFPFDIVKVDRSFVDGVGVGFKESALVHGIVDLAHNLQMQTVAEGIERLEQVQELRSLRCVAGQGYLFGHPAPATEVEQLLAPRCLFGR